VASPTKSQRRLAQPTARRILETARAIIEESGESGLRMTELVERSGTTVGSVYHFFSSREGVIEAVRAHQFDPGTSDGNDNDLRALIDAVTSAGSRNDLDEVVSALIRLVIGETSTDDLWQSFEVIGAARQRTGLRQSIGSAQRARNDLYGELVRALQAKGAIRSDVDAWTVGVFIQSVATGRLLGLMDTDEAHRLDPELWAATATTALGAFLAPD
jgi:AcrR family transcriptional regulator